MAWRTIPSTATNLYSTVSEILAQAMRLNSDWLKSALTDGASAGQEITGSRATLAGTGVALTVTYNGTIGGTLSANVLTTTTMPTSRHDLYLVQHFMGW